MDNQLKFLDRAMQLSREGMEKGHGGPFGCVVVKEGIIIGESWNRVLVENDPTAHAEILAIRNACNHLKDFQLTGCEIFASCEPCPMCLGAIYWARPASVVYANTRYDAAAIEFDDEFIYRQIDTIPGQRKISFIHHPYPPALQVFHEWSGMATRKRY